MDGDFDRYTRIVTLDTSKRAAYCACYRFRQVRSFLENDTGQSTVEYAVVAAVFIAIVVALGALANVLGDGLFVQHALAAASHHVKGSLGGAIDAFCF